MPIRRFSPENLESLRTRAGLTRGELAAECEVLRESITNWEIGKREPRANSIALLSVALDCSVAALFVNEKGPASEDTPGLPEEVMQTATLTTTTALLGRNDEHASD